MPFVSDSNRNLRLLIDVGNTRLKWALMDPDGRLTATKARDLLEPDGRDDCLEVPGLDLVDGVAIASVNPPIADRIARRLEGSGIGPIHWFRSASDVPIRHRLDAPDRTGADRALAVLAACAIAERSGPGIVVQCGTAITVERIDLDGIWQGGAIAIGPGLAARSLHRATAQLPDPGVLSSVEPPHPWGPSTHPALQAGLFWGAVGAIRELIARQSGIGAPPSWIAWTGGDAPTLAPHVDSPAPWIEPDLVLRGIALALEATEPGAVER